MATSPPILIYTPGGGVPVGPVSNPPVYSQAGTTQLVEGQAYVDVVFGSIQTDDEWVLVECIVVNELDVEPLNIWPGIITDKTQAGFRLQLNGLPDSGNYYLHWAVSGVNIVPSVASTYLLSGPSTGEVGVAVTFTVSLSPSTTVSGTITVTPDDGGVAGVFSPTSIELTTSSASATFTYTPASYGAVTISATNNSTLSNPANLTLTVATPTYTLTGPSTGVSGVASTDFTVELSGGVAGTVTVTPSAGDGTFTPTTVALTTGTPSATFTYTPASAGTKTISVTNDGGLTNPANLSYVATAPPFSPTDLAGLIFWFKADTLVLSDGDPVTTWADSSGNGNDVTQATGGAKPIYKTNIVNSKPVVRFDGSNDYLAFAAADYTFVSNFSVFAVYQTSGDNCLVASKTVNNQVFRVGRSGANVLSFNDGSSDAISNTLTAARSAWNLGTIERQSGTVLFWEAGTFLNGAACTGSIGVGAIGALSGIGALYTAGDIAEILVYDSALGATDRQNVEDYLKARYAIA